MKRIRSRIIDHCKEMLIPAASQEEGIRISDGLFAIVPESYLLFDAEFNFLPSNDESESYIELSDDHAGWIYEFGGRIYTLSKDYEDFSFNELKYRGKPAQKLPTKAFLGVRSGHEILNGVGLYDDWIKKAKFLGVESLGICEKKTLSGALAFQKQCASAGIKSIIGMTIPISSDDTYEIKAYAKNYDGWHNLLKFNYQLNVEDHFSIKESFLLKNKEGLFIIVDPKNSDFAAISKLRKSAEVFYQLDPVEFVNPERDRAYLDNLEKFILSDIDPISITDAFYLEKEDRYVRELLWNTAKSFDDKTSNQYFKNKDQYAKELIDMFEGGNSSWISLFKKAVASELRVAEECNFTYNTSNRHLPKYKMSEEEQSKFKNNDELFIYLLKEGFKKRKIVNRAKYLDRLKMEIDVLRKGDVIDYFLSLYDIVKKAHEMGILTGIGRGSAGGSLVSYLLGLIQIDPIEFDLLFERFLNEGRMGNIVPCDLYEIETDDGVIEIIEESVVRIKRGDKEKVVSIEEVQEGDQILKY